MYNEEKYTDHPVTDSVQKCINIFESDESEDHKEFFKRLIQLCKIISNRINSIDYYTAPTYLVDSISNNLNKAVSEYNNFKSRKNNSHLSNVEKHVETALVNSKHLFVATGDIESDYAEVLKNFRKSAGQHLRYFEENAKNIKELNDSLDGDLKAMNKQIDQQKNRIDKVVSDFQNQVSSIQQKHLNEFQEKQNSRDERFKNSLEQLMKTGKEEVNELKEKTTLKIRKIENESSSLIETLTEKKDEALELVSVVANSGMAGGYQKIANQAMWTKRVWQSLTVLSLFGLIYFSIIMYKSTIENGTDLTLGVAGIRIFVTIAIALFAGYSAKQADTNSKIERRNRQMEIELSSIDMYLAKFKEEEQLGIKKKLSDKFFGNLPVDKPGSESKSQTTMMGHLTEAVRNFSEKLNG